MSAAIHALRGALRAGVQVSVDGGDLLLEAAVEPPSSVVAAIFQHKAAVVALLRGTEERNFAKAATLERVADPDSLPEFLDRVKHPRPGDLLTYSWVNQYPSGGRMKH